MEKIGRPAGHSVRAFCDMVFSRKHVIRAAIIYKLVRKPLEPQNSIDRQYLYYLPFCQVFSSNDVFHKTVAPLFLAADQSFVPGEDLKHDLAKIEQHWREIPPDVKAQGSMNYAAYPPRNPELLPASMRTADLRCLATPRQAYGYLAVIIATWACNWPMMRLALAHTEHGLCLFCGWREA